MGTDIVNIETFSNDFKSLLPELDLRLSKLVSASSSLKQLAAKGVNGEVDEKLKKFIMAAKATKKDFNDKRMPLTRQLSLIAKQFTDLENSIEKEVTDISTIRNEYAAKLAKEENAKRVAAEFEINKKKELIEIEGNATTALNEYVINLALEVNKSILSELKNSNDGDGLLSFVNGINEKLNTKQFVQFTFNFKSKYDNNTSEIAKEALKKLLPELRKKYSDFISQYKSDAKMLIAGIMKGTVSNLEESINAADRKAIIDSDAAIEIAKVESEIEKDSQKADLAFDTVLEQNTELNVNQSYKIKVLKDAGYQVLVAWWFSSCFSEFKGNILTKTVQSMIGDIERIANKRNEFLKSDYIIYETEIKAK